MKNSKSSSLDLRSIKNAALISRLIKIQEGKYVLPSYKHSGKAAVKAPPKEEKKK